MVLMTGSPFVFEVSVTSLVGSVVIFGLLGID
jgi:hypothetical protein